MTPHKSGIRNALGILLVVGACALFVIGCGGGDDNSTDPGTDPVDYSPNVDDDVATSLAANLAAENGGAAEQFADIVDLAGTYGLSHTNIVANQLSATYDMDFKYWEWDFARDYSSANGLYQAHVERVYRWRFLKKNGQPQVTYVFSTDTAYTIELTVVSGAGRHSTPFLSQTLDSISGYFVATGTNTNHITINGSWYRSAIDTIRTRYAVRTFDHVCSLTVSDLQWDRDTSTQPWRGVSGTITGTYSGDIHFISGDAYAENTVSREFSVALDTGVAAITLGDTTWTFGLRRGDILLLPESD